MALFPKLKSPHTTWPKRALDSLKASTLIRVPLPKILVYPLLLVTFLSNAATTNADNDFDIFQLSLSELAEVEIESAGKRKERVQDIPAQVIVLRREDIRRGGFTSLNELVESLPYIYNLYQYNGAPGNFGNRGIWNGRGQNSNLAILINGVSQTRRDNRTNPLSKINIPVEAIERIELIFGPMSVIYGNGAFSGILNIVTYSHVNRSEQQSKGRTAATLGTGSNATHRGYAEFTRLADNWSVSAIAGVYQTDGLSPAIVDLVSEQNLAQLLALGVPDPLDYSLSDRLERSSDYVQLDIHFEQLELSYSYNSADNEIFLLLPPVDDGTVQASENHLFNFGYLFELTDNASLRASISYEDLDQVQDFDALFSGFEGENTLRYEYFDAELVAEINMQNDIDWIVGMEWRKFDNFREFTNAPLVGIVNESVEIDNRITSSFFTQITVPFAQRWQGVLGYRYEKVSIHDRFGISFGGTDAQQTFGGPLGGQETHTPRLGLQYNINDSNSVKFLYGKANKLSNDRFSDPEEVETLEILYGFTTPDTLLNVSLFYNQLDNLRFEELELLPDGSAINRLKLDGAGQNWGLSGRWVRRFANNLEFDLSATYQNSDDDVSIVEELSYSPAWQALGTVNYDIAPFHLQLSARYVDSMLSEYRETTQNRDGTFGAFIGAPSDAYTRVDISLLYDLPMGDSHLAMRISNLFDTQIRYPNNQQNTDLLDLGTLGQERQLHVAVHTSF